MTISVVIPAYNEEKFLPLTLGALKKQDRQPDEIIVVDASSTDKTVEAAKAQGALVFTVPKKTIGFSRQQGLLKAKSDLVVFTDADAQPPRDWLGKIEKVMSDPKTFGYFGGFRVPDGPWWYKLYINYWQPILNTILFSLFRIPMATGQNMGFRKTDALAVGGFPEEFKIAEDIEIARRLMEKGRIIFTQKEFVVASGRRGNEGIGIFTRVSKAFFYYFLFRKANKVGFPDIR